MARLRYNGLAADLAEPLGTADTTITFEAALTHSGGTAVPTISGGDIIPLALLDAAGELREIVHLTAYTTGATTGTILRAQESTTATTHTSTGRAVNGPTVTDMAGAGSLNDLTDVDTATVPPTTGQALVWDGSQWEPGTVAGGGSVVRYASAKRTTGDISLTATTPTAVEPTLDLTLTAAAGDLIEIGISGLYGNAPEYVALDAYTRVSGANVNPFGPGIASGFTPGGVQGWYAAAVGQDFPLNGGETRVLTAADISAGTVTIRLMYVKMTSTVRILFANNNNPFKWWAINHGPPS